MQFDRFSLGKTLSGNQMDGFITPNVFGEKWCYLISGIQGDEPEAIYVANELQKWITTSLFTDLPIIIIPTLNVDGLIFYQRFNGRGKNLNRSFPFTYFQPNSPLSHDHETELECQNIVDCLLKYPPQMLINLRTSNDPKIIIQGYDGMEIGNFIQKHTHYKLIADNRSVPGSLEAYVYDFHLCPVVTIKLPKASDHKTFAKIWEECGKPLKQLFSGQRN